MKKKASSFLKQVVSLLVSIVKAKSVALKSKTSAVKSRLIIFRLLHNKKVLMSTISHKIHALLSQDKEGSSASHDDNSNAIVLYNPVATEEPGYGASADVLWSCSRKADVEEEEEEEDDDDDYPDLRHSLFDDEDAYLDGTGSVVDLVKNSRGEDQGEFVLEDEINHVADVFIRRFHRQIRMQKLESFKRYQEMLERSV